jgi:hypothetical protein
VTEVDAVSGAYPAGDEDVEGRVVAPGDWKIPVRRPRLPHEPRNAWLIVAGCLPAIRLSTVVAACAPIGPTAWQLIRSGCPDGAAASPAATTRSSSMLVNVSSVSSRPSVSVRSPLTR